MTTNVLASAGSSDTPWYVVLLSYWWLIFLIGPPIMGFLGAAWADMNKSIRRWTRGRREFKLEMAKIRAGQLRAQPAEDPRPVDDLGALVEATRPVVRRGPCAHNKIVPVHESVSGDLVGWLCKHCDQQLPADYAHLQQPEGD